MMKPVRYVRPMVMVNALDFAQLRYANEQRLPQFKNRKGEPAHSKADGSDWSLNDWGVAAGGEMGELLSLLKQVRRGDVALDELREDIGKEIADVIIYLDILAKQLGLDTGKIVAKKFDEVSRRVGSDLRLCDYPGYTREWIDEAGDAFVVDQPRSETFRRRLRGEKC